MSASPRPPLAALALALGCTPAAEGPQTPAPAVEGAAGGAGGGAAEAPAGRVLTRWEEVAGAIGQEVRVVGTARDAKLAAAVVVDSSPIYCLGQERWPEGVAGQEVELRGVLVRSDRYAAKVDADGAISQGTEGPVTAVEGCAFHLLTIDPGAGAR